MSTKPPISASNIVKRVQSLWCHFSRLLGTLAPGGDLILRLWVANVFFASALTKIQSFETTVMLFEYEFAVPLLPPVAAAWIGTGIELLFPVLLAVGLTGRFSAVVLFLFNIVAAISYPDISDAGIRDHQIWGIMLLVMLLHGPGKLSLDYLLFHKLRIFRPKETE